MDAAAEQVEGTGEDHRPVGDECLVCFLRRAVAEAGCEHTWRWARRYRDLRVPGATGLERRLAAVGAGCDCTVLERGWWPVRAVWERDVDTDELRPPQVWPGCEGVGLTSARPCGRWVRRTCWDDHERR